MHLSNNLIVASLFVIASSFVNAAVTTPFTTVQSQDDFCLFLPPKPGLVVAVNENDGIAFCTKKNLVSKSTVFPTGFITTAHYLKSSTYVQITGFFDRSKYDLGITDGGGQYDNHGHGKPVGAMCKGYNFFVSLIEPDVERFCIRCCQDKVDCNTGRSGYGCLRVVSGDYTRDNNFGTTNKTSTHRNTNIDSVLSELNELPATDDVATATDAADASTTTVDYATDAPTATDASDDTTSDDTTSDDTAYTVDDTTTTDATAAIASAADALNAYIVANEPSVDEIKTKWSAFATQFATTYPELSDQISLLTGITTGFTTTTQWYTYLDLLKNNAQADDSDAAAATTTTASADSTATHTDSQSDLDWLFNHRNSHDNQATW